VNAGIIAAGLGQRLGGGPKALIPVGGRRLIDLVIEGLIDAGVGRLTCIVNSSSREVSQHVARTFPQLPVDWIVRDTPTSMHSFLAVLETLAAAGGAGHLLTTVDSVCPPGTARRFVERAAAIPGADLVLGVTTTIDDEKPLYAIPRENVAPPLADAPPFEVAALSSSAGASPFVTAGFYWVTPGLLAQREHALAANFTALRQFLGHLLQRGRRCWAVPLPQIIDVDRPADVRQAERLLEAWAARTEASA